MKRNVQPTSLFVTVAIVLLLDCVDGFLGAYWRRPHAYLDAGVRSAISTFAKTNPRAVESGVERLRRDLEDGTWIRRHGHLLDRTEVDLGYRIVIATR